MGLLNIYTLIANKCSRGDRQHLAGGGCSKKHALSLPEGSVQQGRSHFDARSVLSVREHGKMARTPLAAFFNIPPIIH